MTTTLMGLRLIISENALEETTERLFPASKNRSRRIHKKLVKRHGGEFRMVPATFRTADTLIMHPAMFARLKAATEGHAILAGPI